MSRKQSSMSPPDDCMPDSMIFAVHSGLWNSVQKFWKFRSMLLSILRATFASFAQILGTVYDVDLRGCQPVYRKCVEIHRISFVCFE